MKYLKNLLDIKKRPDKTTLDSKFHVIDFQVNMCNHVGLLA